jgi:hypothetical protein
MRRGIVAIGVALASLAAALAAGAATGGGTTKLEAQLRGRNEVPAAPASNRGKVELRLTPSSGRVCWEFKLAKIDGRPTQAHIHIGRKGVSGNVFIPLVAHGKPYTRQGCATAKRAMVRAVLGKPSAYYVNVHNAKHPAGAMRGQLVRES